MGIFVERTCTVVEDGTDGSREAESRPLAEFRDCSAYVLLGAPGSGKTAAFEREAEKPAFCDARNFMTLDDKRWAGVRTLFIDGLDEVRAGTVDGRSQLDAIRGRLDRLGRPRFRLSCREADWFCAADWKRLESVSPDGAVKVLRLDTLSEDNIRTILDDKGAQDIDRFIDEARDRGLGTLLSSPQTLKLLAAAVADGNWPATRTDTFEAACRTLIRELNDEHLQAVPQRADSEMLHTAGHLCAVQLLSGRAGYRLPIRTDKVDAYIDLRDIREPSQATLLATLHTKVFDVTDGLATPIHRHIAEFLAGRHLSALIDAGLPPRRVLSLLTGYDGRTLSALRGLAAWLAVHCQEARYKDVERDPLGTVLYGDVKAFSVDEKRRLLSFLERDAERDPQYFAAMHDMDNRWADLATQDMEGIFRDILTSAANSHGRQTVAMAVLQSLERGTIMPGLASMLMDIVRNSECWPGVREAALRAYVRQCTDKGDADATLKALLADVYEGTISDPLDNLLGLLLRKLYPRALPPNEVGRYLREVTKGNFIGWYVWFWEHDVTERSTNNQLAEVLDSLVENFGAGEWKRGYSGSLPYWSRTIPTKLLAAYLRRSPVVDDERLFTWFGLASKRGDQTVAEDIRGWLGNNPKSFKTLVRLAADHYADPSLLRRETYSLLFFALKSSFFSMPPDFGAWCLTQATKTETNTTAATEFFLDWVIARRDREGISDEFVKKRLAHDPELIAQYSELRQRSEQESSDSTPDLADLQQRREFEEKKHREEWQDLVKTQVSALRQNQANPAHLHYLASVYMGRYWEIGDATGRLRLQNLLGDEGLVDVVIEAFRASTRRTDLPDVTEIFRLANKGSFHYLTFPFLAGLDEHHLLLPGQAPLGEDNIRRALAFRFNGPDSWYEKTNWYYAVLVCRPQVVANVLVRSGRARLQRGESTFVGLYELGHDNAHDEVARLAIAPLLKSFPTRCRVSQLNTLRLLLHAASRHVDDNELLEIVERKLHLPSMSGAQRMYWICTGLLMTPALFTDQIRDALKGPGRERRTEHMAQFLCGRPSIEVLDVPALELLIGSLGNSHRPYWSDDDSMSAKNGTKKNSNQVSHLIDLLINTLSSRPCREASYALERLSERATLRPWQLRLRDAASRQREVRREADYRHPSVEQVLETLDNRHPANAADLAALSMDVLDALATGIRDGDTSDWRQYWNVDSHNRAQDPKPEDACRDALLSDLKARLAPLGVDAQPEGTYADDKRADIRVSCDGFNVPIEIKRSSHDDLWRAIRNQLIAKYTRDPGAAGYGIYLVFWFGPDRCKRPPNGPAPQTPGALRDQLLASANLSPEERRKISVCVIDVSKPSSQSGSMPA